MPNDLIEEQNPEGLQETEEETIIHEETLVDSEELEDGEELINIPLETLESIFGEDERPEDSY